MFFPYEPLDLQDPETVKEGAKFAFKLFLGLVVVILVIAGLYYFLSQIITIHY